MLLSVLLISAILILIYAYVRGINNRNYWKKRGVAFDEKHSIGGPLWLYATQNRSFFEILNDVYKTYEDAPAVGLGALFNRSLYVKDPVNMMHVSQVDFQSFYLRGIPINDDDHLANNILLLGGPKWKLIRQKLTPLFTASKLKNMYYIIDKSAQDFVEYLKLNPDKLRGDAFDTVCRFCTAAISAAVFGIGTKSTFDSPFRTMAQEALAPTFSFNLKFVIAGISDVLYKALGLKLFAKHENFFIEAIRRVIKQREKEGIKRHDFADMCVNLQRNGTMHDPDTGLTLEPSDEVLAAQAFFFFLAGVEPTAMAIYGTMLELGRNPDMQKLVHEEVDAVFEKYNNQITYEATSEVEYLDKVLSESLRHHCPISTLTRECTQDTVLPVGNIHVEKGVKILTPIYELHHDPKYFPNPEVFDPERFSREGEINDLAYVPFGKGNRMCIGARYARLQVLSGLMHFLRNYSLVTYVGKGGIMYKKEQNQVRIKNVRIEFIPRK